MNLDVKMEAIMKIKLISLFVTVALVTALLAFAAVPAPVVRVADLSAPGAGAHLDTETIVNYQGQTHGTGPIIVAQENVIEIFGSAEEPVPIDWGRSLETRDYEEPTSTPAFCDYYREPTAGPSYPPSDFLPPC